MQRQFLGTVSHFCQLSLELRSTTLFINQFAVASHTKHTLAYLFLDLNLLPDELRNMNLGTSSLLHAVHNSVDMVVYSWFHSFLNSVVVCPLVDIWRKTEPSFWFTVCCIVFFAFVKVVLNRLKVKAKWSFPLDAGLWHCCSCLHKVIASVQILWLVS